VKTVVAAGVFLSVWRDDGVNAAAEWNERKE